ncbi:zinc finger CCCH domain-containing protein 24 [Phtheirospermum japonicum]|uniref:Zinc finger CCCH domain-containing protein 24 n=1 Tax=Phtheirospermum japonicum TaxID=374723 RepID=A0A830BDJ7_9LAMI|nr:zinc finger CCCH domain-containing protein 24 [Phtheirospermum japonicum]
MSEVPPPETLSPTMDRHDSADQLDTIETPSSHSPADDANPPEKLEQEPEPDTTETPSSHSSDQFDTTGNHSSHLSAGDANPAEKRKREPEPDPAPRQKHPLWKTSLCSYFRRTGDSCSHGESCRYAHSEAELRQRPDNSWDPTSERAKKMARTDETEKEDAAAEAGVMMTEALEDGEEESSSGLSKCVVNLPMKWSSDNLRNFLGEQGIVFKSAKKKKGMIVGFVTFESAEQAKVAVEGLDGKTVGNNRTLKVSDVIPRPFEKNNKAALQKPSPDGAHSNQAESTNSDKVDDDGNLVPNVLALKSRSARDAVTPLAHMSYSDQLEHKKNSLAQILKRLTRNARKACPNGVSLPEWVMNSKDIGGLPCKLEGIIESPLVNGYRNKCEFSVGCSLQGKHTVGFLLGNFREGVTAVEEPVDCPNVSSIASRYANVFQEYLQQSKLPLWNRLNNTGFWRQLTVREGRTPCKNAEVDNPETNISEVMLIVQRSHISTLYKCLKMEFDRLVRTVGFDDGQVKDELERLAQAFYAGSIAESPCLPLTALVIQDHTGISNAAPPDAPLPYVFTHKGGDCGLQIANDVVEPRIHDHISNLKFSISPSAFFQVNTLAAEKLYSLAGDWAELGPDTLLFDVCCGTGTIGLTLAHRVGMVVGIEMNASAVLDAQRNAEINDINNCRFVCGKAEDVIGPLMKEYISLTQNQDETGDTLQNIESEIKSSEEDADPADSMTGTEDGSSVDHENGSKDEKQLKQFKNIVAIVDPPRVGLHPTVTRVLRTQSHLRRLVYISCNPESLVANAIELCTPSPVTTEKGNNKNNRGWKSMSSAGLARRRTKSMPSSEPFKPVKAMAVDLFPHTPHCELVMLLER